MHHQSSATALVPAWQSADFIQKTLESLSAQTYKNFKVIISVDQSEDNTYEVCAEYAKKDPRFSVIKQDQRLGYVGNCNALLDQADSDYVMFAFHDDILAPEYIESLVSALDNHPDAVMGYSDMEVTQLNGKKAVRIFDALDGLNRFERADKMLQPIKFWWVPNRGLFRLKMSKQINGLKIHGAGEFMADWPWLFHMSLLGEFVRVPKVLCYKFYKTESLSKSWERSDEEFFEVRAACMKELWNSNLSSEEKALLSCPSVYKMIRKKHRKGVRLWKIQSWIVRFLLK